ncbi:hypothetical protein L798_07365 [Zootermopsis nevadensis]|uniref:Uncharacterized protein n=1 Tax=Zootermopsis nevadensis TaxID=136037 RepID=A0A067R7V1_ZOONE|nr:hypothetical protein L798_07365 [Zootermopsis nevadensis]
MPSAGKNKNDKKHLTYAMLRSTQSDSVHTKVCIASHNETRPALTKLNTRSVEVGKVYQSAQEKPP